jgi:mono/diheme cytochrome c family protein
MARNFFLTLIIVALIGYSCSTERKETPKMVSKQTKKIKAPETTHPGKIVYIQFCLACHMENGEGVPGLYPPLSQTDFVLGDKKRLIETVLHGMDGPIEVKGEKYNNIMAKLDYLRDDQIAEVLTFVRSNFGNKADAVTSEEVQIVRKAIVK